MKKTLQILCGICALLILFANATEVKASTDCRSYTIEQKELMFRAFQFAEISGYAFTLPAIIVKESFWGDMIIKRNLGDIESRFRDMPVEPRGSFGSTHILLSTAMDELGLSPFDWRQNVEAMSWVPDWLLVNENSWQMSLELLDKHRKRLFGNGRPRTQVEWRMLWGSWNSKLNGADSDYSLAIAAIVDEFITCDVFSDIISYSDE